MGTLTISSLTVVLEHTPKLGTPCMKQYILAWALANFADTVSRWR